MSVKRKKSEKEVILKSLTASVKHLEEKACLSQENRTWLQINEKLTRKYGEQRTVVCRGVGNLMTSIATHLVLVAMCISRAIWMCYRRVLSELDYFRKQLRRN